MAASLANRWSSCETAGGWLGGRRPGSRIGGSGVRQGRDLRMQVDEYTLRLSVCVCVSVRQQTAIDEAMRTNWVVRNKALRLWMNGHGVGRGVGRGEVPTRRGAD